MSRWLFSPHAVGRMAEMDVSVEEILWALRDPECNYPGRPSSDGSPTRLAVAGRVAVIYSARDHVVITVLWHGRDSRSAA
jgi:hypothetical protein